MGNLHRANQFCLPINLSRKLVFLYKGELSTYSNDFINNYLYPIIYPEGLNAEIQIYLGISLIVINILIYGLIYKNFKRK